MGVISVFDVANYFLAKEDENVFSEPMTHLKLQKLVYYAQAFHLAEYGESLFPEAFEAWAHGPVSPTLYAAFKTYGYNPIPIKPKINLSIFPNYIRETLDRVWEKFGHLTAKQLEHMTHQEYPWIEARGDTPYGENCTEEINEFTMKEYYKGLILMKNEKKSIKPLFTLDEVRKIASSIDRSSRGSDEQYFEVINAEMEQFKLLRERVAGGWREEQ